MAENETHDREPDVFTDAAESDGLVGILLRIRSSFLLFVLTLGVLLLVGGMVMSDGVFAGLFGIWGVSALIYAGFGFVFLRAIGYS